jgi:uncharacterized protein (DUF2141 family)
MKIYIFLFFLALPLTAFAQNKNKILVNVSAIRNADGVIRASLYSSKKGFPSKPEKAYMITSSTITKNEAVLIFENVPSGKYAVSVVHDENNNGKIDKTWAGMPKEGVGSSNNPKTMSGPPSFKSSSFEVFSTSVTLNINITYFKK